MANTYVTETLSGATFYDATTKATTTLSGSWLAEYDSSGNLVSVYNPSFSITTPAGVVTSWNAGTGSGASPYLVHATGSSNTAAYQKLYVDYTGETPSTLLGGTTAGTTAGTSTSVYNSVTGNTDFLQSTGTITSSADTAVTTTIKGAVFADNSTLSGTWTAIYDSSGTLQGVENASFVVTSTTGATNTFTAGGTLPYANTAAGSSYEIHFGTVTGSGAFTALYVDWKSENPSSFYEGSPSLYTSVVNNGSSPIRLAGDGTSGTGSVPLISGLPATASGTDTTPVAPFSTVSVTDSDSTTTTSATVILNVSGVASDANGTLSGTGLTKSATGTYTLAATSPASLTSELQALTFTPTVAEGASGTTFTTKIDLSINDSDGSASASTVLTETATCFLAGTLIATPTGDVAVETLRAGDVVSVLEAGGPVDRTIVWAGRGRMDAARFDHRDEAFPIRIRAGAFADAVPARDLLVTPEHCLLTEAGLVPARMLVNGASILIDRTLPAYDFFHVELDQHAILLAEGLATESYLDTGNRFLFADASPDAARPADAPPVLALAAPLAVARALVEPVWTGLAERAAGLGFERPAGAVRASVLTDDPELRLLLEDGVELSACSGDPLHHTFRIPAGVRPVRLLSRLAVPAQVIGPFVDDRRTLGVQVEKLVLWAGLTDIVLPASGLTLAGWHENEGGLRWTNGMASLDLPATSEPTFIDVHLSGTALYPERQMA